MKFKIHSHKPWFFPIIKHFFPSLNWDGKDAYMGDAFVFGSNIYCKDKDKMSYFMKAHEAIHIEQQRGNTIGAIKWWYNYIKSPKFRLAQEADAYGFEHKLFRQRVHDRNKQAQHLDYCARAMSSDLYKNLISYEEAKKFLLKQAGVV